MVHNPHLEGGPFLWEGNQLGILLVHGFTATTAEMRLLAERLHKEKNYTISAPLLPGHLTTPEDLNSKTWQDWFDSVDFAYQMLSKRCQQVFVGGESMGGVLALLLASKYPEIAGLMVYAPAIKLPLSIVEQLRLRVASYFIPSIPKEHMDSNQYWQGYSENPLKAAVQLIKLQNVVKKKLHLIEQPLIIFQGRLDEAIHPNSGEIILSKVSTPSSAKNLHWMENTAHCVVLDKELDQVTELTFKFIEDHIQ